MAEFDWMALDSATMLLVIGVWFMVGVLGFIAGRLR